MGRYAIPNHHQVDYGYTRIAPIQEGVWKSGPAYSDKTFIRVVINTSKRIMFNRIGVVLPQTVSLLFKPRMEKICDLFPNAWVTGFIRGRTQDPAWGQGSILIDDLYDPDLNYEERQDKISNRVSELGICVKLPNTQLLKTPLFPEHITRALWAALNEVQKAWDEKNPDYYSGVTLNAVKGWYSPIQNNMRTGSRLHYQFNPALQLTVKTEEQINAAASG